MIHPCRMTSTFIRSDESAPASSCSMSLYSGIEHTPSFYRSLGSPTHKGEKAQIENGRKKVDPRGQVGCGVWNWQNVRSAHALAFFPEELGVYKSRQRWFVTTSPNQIKKDDVNVYTFGELSFYIPIRSFPEGDRSGKRPDLFERARLVAIDHPCRMVLKRRKE